MTRWPLLRVSMNIPCEEESQTDDCGMDRRGPRGKGPRALHNGHARRGAEAVGLAEDGRDEDPFVEVGTYLCRVGALQPFQPCVGDEVDGVVAREVVGDGGHLGQRVEGDGARHLVRLPVDDAHDGLERALVEDGRKFPVEEAVGVGGRFLAVHLVHCSGARRCHGEVLFGNP